MAQATDRVLNACTGCGKPIYESQGAFVPGYDMPRPGIYHSGCYDKPKS
jgi:hypothetical protein